MMMVHFAFIHIIPSHSHEYDCINGIIANSVGDNDKYDLGFTSILTIGVEIMTIEKQFIITKTIIVLISAGAKRNNIVRNGIKYI